MKRLFAAMIIGILCLSMFSVLRLAPDETSAASSATVTFSASGLGMYASGSVLIVAGTTYSVSQLPLSVSATVGSGITFSWYSTVTGSSTVEYVWESTSGLSTQQSGTVTVLSGGGSVGATYSPFYLVTYVVSPSGDGTVTVSGGGTYVPPVTSSQVGGYYPGATVTLSEVPNSEYQLEGWSSSPSSLLTGSSSSSNTSATINSGGTITANFEPTSTPTTLSVSANPTSVTESPPQYSTITATVHDQYGNLMSDVQVSFTTTAGVLSSSTATTNGQGQAQVTLTPNFEGSSPVMVTITAAVSSLQQTTTVTFEPPSTPTTLSVSANPTSVTESPPQYSTITATVHDQYGNLMSDVQVSFTTTAGVLSSSTATTNGQGQAQVTLTPNFEGSSPVMVTITAAVSSLQQTTTVTFEPPSTPSFQFTVSTSGNLFTVNVGESVDVPVSVNLVSGTSQQVSLSVAWTPTGSNQWFTTSFSPNSGDPSFTSTLDITTLDGTPSGSYTAQILASIGGNVESTTITVAVNPQLQVISWQIFEAPVFQSIPTTCDQHSAQLATDSTYCYATSIITPNEVYAGYAFYVVVTVENTGEGDLQIPVLKGSAPGVDAAGLSFPSISESGYRVDSTTGSPPTWQRSASQSVPTGGPTYLVFYVEAPTWAYMNPRTFLDSLEDAIISAGIDSIEAIQKPLAYILSGEYSVLNILIENGDFVDSAEYTLTLSATGSESISSSTYTLHVSAPQFKIDSMNELIATEILFPVGSAALDVGIDCIVPEANPLVDGSLIGFEASSETTLVYELERAISDPSTNYTNLVPPPTLPSWILSLSGDPNYELISDIYMYYAFMNASAESTDLATGALMANSTNYAYDQEYLASEYASSASVYYSNMTSLVEEVLTQLYTEGDLNYTAFQTGQAYLSQYGLPPQVENVLEGLGQLQYVNITQFETIQYTPVNDTSIGLLSAVPDAGQFLLINNDVYQEVISAVMSSMIAIGSPLYTFSNPTSALNAECQLFWVADTVAGANQSYLTVGGNGMTFYGGSSPQLANSLIGGSGFLTGAAWDGEDFLLVGQHYSPPAGVTMYLYDPVANSLTDLTGLFSPSLSLNATLLESTWSGSVFYILGLENENANVSPILLFSYNPVSNDLTDLTPLLPSNFINVNRFAAQEMLWTPSGLYLLLQGTTGNLFGVLSQNTFTDLSSLLPSSFTVPYGNGIIVNLFAYLLAWNGTQLFLAGQTTSGDIALLAYNPSSNQITDYSSFYSGFTGTPCSLAYSNGRLYLSGFTGSWPAALYPFLTALDSSLNLFNLTTLVPASFGVIDTLTANGADIFISGGTWSQIQYGLLSPLSHDVAVTNVLSSKIVLGQGSSDSINVTVANQGDYTETFTITVYANTSMIGTATVYNLVNGTSTILTFTWDTTDFAFGNYTVSAYAEPVTGEINVANNTFVGGTVQVIQNGSGSGGKMPSPDTSSGFTGWAVTSGCTISNNATLSTTVITYVGNSSLIAYFLTHMLSATSFNRRSISYSYSPNPSSAINGTVSSNQTISSFTIDFTHCIIRLSDR